ncbi:hypothetical protein DERP_008505 [Dermatophagoides pteronyssinus]|uniref:Uncharacterized protein n=1 Tax=Dermatophagoides pteronyssinus TaxID=6956 RepID=A0ABQ8IVF9_DERPT|nr:hypothetical protein DERP_008505 [Dermatophagoides pteronyssinus]
MIQLFFESIVEYRLLDQNYLSSIVDSNDAGNDDNNNNSIQCLNISIKIQDFIIKKNNVARLTLFQIIFTITIIISAILMINPNWILITIQTIFQSISLILNLFIPFLSSYSIIMLIILITITSLNMICIIFKIRLNIDIIRRRRRRRIVREMIEIDNDGDGDDDKSENIRPEISDPIPLEHRSSIVQFQSHQPSPMLQQHYQTSLPFTTIVQEQIPFINSNHQHQHYEGRTTF